MMIIEKQDRTMNKLFAMILISFAFIVHPVKAQNKTVNLTNSAEQASIDVIVRNGSVSVVGYDGDTIEISSDIRAVKIAGNKSNNGHQEGPRITLGSAGVEVKEANNNLKIVSLSVKYVVNLVIKVPIKSDLEIWVEKGGDISISNVLGQMGVSAGTGTIKAMGINGPIVAETQSKNIHIGFSVLNQNKPSYLVSHSGNIEIDISSAVKSNIEIETLKGEIFSGSQDDLKKQNKGKNSLLNEYGSLVLPFKGGGQKLSVNTYSGNVYIRNEQK